MIIVLVKGYCNAVALEFENHFSFLYIVLVFFKAFYILVLYSSDATIFIFVLCSSQNISVLVYRQTSVSHRVGSLLRVSVTATPSL